jgi:hypothetical protein
VQAIEADICEEPSAWDRATGWWQRECLLRFDLSEADLSRILASAPFAELEYADYRKGLLDCGWRARSSGNVTLVFSRQFRLYETMEEEPMWLDLAQWKNVRAWIAQEERRGSWYKARLVLYNEQLKQACFVVHEEQGEWDGRRSISRPQPNDIADATKRMEDVIANSPKSFAEEMEKSREYGEEVQRSAEEWVRQIEEARKHGRSEANIPLLPPVPAIREGNGG